MRELAAELSLWHAARRPYAIATVVGVIGSAPRPPGAVLAVAGTGEVIGSISGGCVEGVAYDLCLEVLRTGTPVLQTFGYDDSDAFAVGLTCGGALDVFVQAITPPDYPVVEEILRSERPVALVRDLVTGAMATVGTRDAVGPEFDTRVVEEARAMLDVAATGVRVIGCGDEESTIFVESFVPRPHMIVLGAIDFASALCRVGRFLGYHVTVCDARPVFATRARFPDADEIVVDWPHRYLARAQVDSRTVVCVLTHDPKFDIPVLELALRMPIAYVGAMGSRRSDAERRLNLRAAGVTDAELALLHSPIGLELGGRTPEETALSIGAEIVAARRGGSARPLSATDRPIHAASSAATESRFRTAAQNNR